MKRVAVAVALLVASAGMALWSGMKFEKHMNYFESQLLAIINAPEEELPYLTDKIADDWEENGDFLHSVFVHEGIDELEVLITSLPLVLEKSGKDELITRCIDGINSIKNLKSCEKFALRNVL